MKFKEKKTAYNELLGVSFLGKDTSLLQKLAPGTPVLNSGIINIHKKHRAILWKLLEYATADEILDNRKQDQKPAIDSKFSNQLKKIIDSDPSTVEEVINLQKEIKALVSKIGSKDLTDEYRECIDAKEGKLNLGLTNIVTRQAYTIDLGTATQKELAFIARTLNLETPDYKSETLREVISKLRPVPGIEIKGVVDHTIGDKNNGPLPDITSSDGLKISDPVISGETINPNPEKKNPE